MVLSLDDVRVWALLVTAVLLPVLGWVARPGIEAWLRLRKDGRDALKEKEDRADAAKRANEDREIAKIMRGHEDHIKTLLAMNAEYRKDKNELVLQLRQCEQEKVRILEELVDMRQKHEGDSEHG